MSDPTGSAIRASKVTHTALTPIERVVVTHSISDTLCSEYLNEDIGELIAERDALKRRIEVMREALKPFADLGVSSGPDYQIDRYSIEFGAIRAARAALNKDDA